MSTSWGLAPERSSAATESSQKDLLGPNPMAPMMRRCAGLRPSAQQRPDHCDDDEGRRLFGVDQGDRATEGHGSARNDRGTSRVHRSCRDEHERRDVGLEQQGFVGGQYVTDEVDVAHPSPGVNGLVPAPEAGEINVTAPPTGATA